MATRRPIYTDISGAVSTALREISDADYLPIGIIPGGMGRNALINGDFRFWQRGTSSAAAAARRYVADRWEVWSVGSTTAISRQAASGLPASVSFPPRYCMQVVVASLAGAGNFALVRQHVEDCRMFAGKKATFWFWIRSTTASQVAASLDQNFGASGSPSVTLPGQKTSLAANVWTLVPFTFDVPVITGTIDQTSDSLACYIWLDAGANYNARTASLGQRSATYQIAQAMITEGDQALPFEYRHDGIELALCQRYFEKSYPLEIAPANNGGRSGAVAFPQVVGGSTTQFGVSVRYKVEKRASPAVNIYSPQDNSGQVRNVNIGANCSSVGIDAETGPSGFTLFTTTAPGSSVAQSNIFHYSADAEL